MITAAKLSPAKEECQCITRGKRSGGLEGQASAKTGNQIKTGEMRVQDAGSGQIPNGHIEPPVLTTDTRDLQHRRLLEDK
jgi:hypothetical protein